MKTKQWKPTDYHTHDKVVKAYMQQPPRLRRPTEGERHAGEVARKGWYRK